MRYNAGFMKEQKAVQTPSQSTFVTFVAQWHEAGEELSGAEAGLICCGWFRAGRRIVFLTWFDVKSMKNREMKHLRNEGRSSAVKRSLAIDSFVFINAL